MINILENFSTNYLFQTILYPLSELNKEIECISLDKHRTRSACKVIILLFASITLSYFAIINYQIQEILTEIIETFNSSKETIPMLSKCLSIILCSQVATLIANTCTKMFCKIRYNDPEFYLTTERLNILEKKLKEQIDHDITQDEIKAVVEFCIKNFYKENNKELGGKKEDWRKTIECLIYDGDLEHFFDQQKALLMKKIQLEKKSKEILSQSQPNPNLRERRLGYGSMDNSGNRQSLDTTNLDNYSIKQHENELRVKIPDADLLSKEPSFERKQTSFLHEDSNINQNLLKEGELFLNSPFSDSNNALTKLSSQLSNTNEMLCPEEFSKIVLSKEHDKIKSPNKKIKDSRNTLDLCVELNNILRRKSQESEEFHTPIPSPENKLFTPSTFIVDKNSDIQKLPESIIKPSSPNNLKANPKKIVEETNNKEASTKKILRLTS